MQYILLSYRIFDHFCTVIHFDGCLRRHGIRAFNIVFGTDLKSCKVKFTVKGFFLGGGEVVEGGGIASLPFVWD